MLVKLFGDETTLLKHASSMTTVISRCPQTVDEEPLELDEVKPLLEDSAGLNNEERNAEDTDLWSSLQLICFELRCAPALSPDGDVCESSVCIFIYIYIYIYIGGLGELVRPCGSPP